MKKHKKFNPDDVERNARICLLVIGCLLSFTAVVLFGITFFNQKSIIEDAHSWTKTDCVIESRELKSEGKEYSGPDSTATFYWELIYSYYVDGKRYASSVFNVLEPGIYLGKGTFLDYIALTSKQIKDGTGPYPKNSRQVCYVNPNNPEDAVLELAKAGFAKTCASLWKSKRIKVVFEGILFVIGLLISLQGAKVLIPNRYQALKKTRFYILFYWIIPVFAVLCSSGTGL